jgi:hypothetical protein
MNATAFRYAAANGDSNTIVLDNFDGLTLRASCTSGSSTTKGLTVQGSSSVPAFIAYSSIAENGTGLTGGSAKNDSRGLNATFADLMTPGGTVDSGNGSSGIGFSTGQIVYTQNGGGDVVTIVWNYNNNVDGHDCLFSGTVLGHPSATSVGRSASRGVSRSAAERSRAAG